MVKLTFHCKKSIKQLSVPQERGKTQPAGVCVFFCCMKCKQCGYGKNKDHQFCQKCLSNLYESRSPFVITPPPWKTFEKHQFTGDADNQLKASDAFEDSRKKWTSSGKWAKWEKERRNEWKKNKPAWRKERMKSDPLLGHEMK